MKSHFILIVLVLTVIPFCSMAQSVSEETIDSLYSVGLKKARKGQYRSSIVDFQQASKIARDLKDTSAIVQMDVFTGHIERRRANHDTALNYYEKAKALVFEMQKPSQKSIIDIYNGMGSSFRYLDKYKRSLDYYFEALRLTKEKYGEAHFQVGYLYNNIANTYDEYDDTESAMEYYELSKKNLEEYYKDDNNALSNIYNNYGKALIKAGRFEDAEGYLLRSIALQGQVIDNHSPHLVIGLNQLGVVALARGRYSEAIDYHKQSLKVLGLEELSEDYFSEVNSPADCLISLSSLINVYNKQFERIKDDALLIEARKILNLTDNFVSFLKLNFKETESRNVLLKNSYKLYENAITVAYNSEANSEDAFSFSEKSRNNLLREAVQEGKAKQFAGIPDSLLLLETKIKNDIISFQKQRFDEENGENNSLKINALESKIREYKNEYTSLLDTFERRYPDYFALKYAVNTIPVKEIADKLLTEDQGLLEYFIGEEYIYTFIVTPDDYQVIRLENDFNLADSVKAMRKSIFEWRPRAEDAAENLKIYQRTAAFLYDKLMRPIEDKLPKKLIIIPGGILGYLPFEALLTESASEDLSFSNYPYLIREKQISYSYSASLLRETLKNKNTGREVLAFAPSFGNIHKDSLPDNLPYLKSLKYNEDEVSAIQELLGGRVFKGKDATLRNFLDIAPLYKILHLATHGKANDLADEFSYLAFTYQLDTLDNELLYAGNLYNTELRADMVVLSACETGVGDLQRGEGILSLARGFFYAGAKSIVTTLWSIDDKASLDIMVKFYENLEDGDPKDAALRTAKLDFIENNSRRAHPLFWAAYVPFGNMESIAIGRTSNNWIYVFALAILLFVLLYFRNNRS